MDTLINDIVNEGNYFCEKLKTVRSLSCVEGHFGSFLGSAAIADGQKEAEESKIRKKEIISALRNSIKPLYDGSSSWKHSLEKPYGYPGDFSILELIYDNIPHPNTETARGKLIDLWGQSTVLPRAVNARKNALRVYIEQFSQNYSSNQKAKILSIASGSAREIRELTQPSIEKLDITLLDQDERALSFAKGAFYGRANQDAPSTVVADALKPFDDFGDFSQRNSYDLIYSFGLYDYLPDKLIKKSIDNAIKYLSDSGVFVFALKDNRYYPQWFYDWFYDWRFFSRIKEDGFHLANSSGLKVNNTILVESGTIILYICSKQLH